MAIDTKTFNDSLLKKGYSQTAIDTALSQLKSGGNVKDVVAQLKANPNPTQVNNTTVSTRVSEVNPSKNQGVNPVTEVKDVNQITSGNRGGEAWDYNADISKDRDRQKQMLTNLRNYAKNDSQLFQNRDQYNTYFKYDQRDPSQQRLLDYSWENANKFGLNSQENLVADDASSVIKEKNDQKRALLEDKYAAQQKEAQDIINKLSPQYADLWDNMTNELNNVNDELNQIKQFVKDSYNKTIDTYDRMSLGEAAGAASKLSAQGLSDAATGGVVSGFREKRGAEYAKRLEEYKDNMLSLVDKGTNLKNTIWQNQMDLTDKEKKALDDYADTMIELGKDRANELSKLLDDEYDPYEKLTQSKVTGTAEKSQSQAGKNAGAANYMAANDNDKVKIIIDNLGVDENVELKGDYYDALMKIAKTYPNDVNKAISASKALYSKLNEIKNTGGTKTITKTKYVGADGKQYDNEEEWLDSYI